MRKRLGCLSAGGIAAAAITLLVLVGVTLIGGGRLFSPGPLNAQAGVVARGGVRSHADLGERCSACHVAPWSQETMSDRCLICHTEIADQLGDPSRLHNALLAEGLSLVCYTCHTEHRGVAASLTVIAPDLFPHQATGYSLRGHRQMARGEPVTCADCHGEDITRFDLAVCANCHQDLDTPYLLDHIKAFGTGCLACHDGLDTYGEGFDHDQLAFPLLGKHAALPCAACHLGGRTVADLQATSSDCVACHREDDAHAGRLGTDCAQCHTPADWAQATIDHNLTAFPLSGKHQEIDCHACHPDQRFRGTPMDCVACHEIDDAHGGQFGPGCGQCHTPTDWKQVTFDHAQTAFPLIGAHTTTLCLRCHVSGAFKGTPQKCVGCHTEPNFHAGLLDTDCAACHTPDAWSPASYNRPHTFPFSHGADGSSSCRTCHPDSLGGYTCYACHDPGEVAEEHLEEGIGNYQNCVECHPTGEED
jgi:hypothetical protein